MARIASYKSFHATAVCFYLFCQIFILARSYEITDNKVHFTIDEASPYSLVAGEFEVKDFRISEGEPSEVKVGSILRFGSTGELNFRVGSTRSADVANWFNSQCDTSTCTTFGEDSGNLYCAFLGTLRLTISYKHKPAKQHQVVFDDILIAEGLSFAYANWRVASRLCANNGNYEVVCKGATATDDIFSFTFLRGGNSLDKVQITNIKFLTWMKNIDENRALNRLNIPGTHDSATSNYHEEVTKPWVRTQYLSIKEQLESGIRFLDIRCRHVNDVFTIHHDLIYVNTNFGDVLNQCISFLDSNPSESIVMLVKQEHTPEGNSRAFHETFLSYVNNASEYWYRQDTVPTLKDARKKIVLLHRFYFGRDSFGIDVNNWGDNRRFSTWANGITLDVQDEYDVTLDRKKQAIREMVQLSSQNDPSHWYLNFISLAGSVDRGTIYQTSVPNNQLIQEIVLNKHPAFLGTVVFDYPSYQNSLVLDIVYSN